VLNPLTILGMDLNSVKRNQNNMPRQQGEIQRNQPQGQRWQDRTGWGEVGRRHRVWVGH
jgi:hypothetical protein